MNREFGTLDLFPFLGILTCLLACLLFIVMTKAAVLPVPVCAHPIMSLPSRMAGIAWDWISVGAV